MALTSKFDKLPIDQKMAVLQKCDELRYSDINEFHEFLKNEIGINCSRSTAGEYSRQAKVESQRLFKRMREAQLIAKIVEESGTEYDLAVANAVLLQGRVHDIINELTFTDDEIKDLTSKEKIALLKLLTESQNYLTSITAKAIPSRATANAAKQNENGIKTNQLSDLQSIYMAKILKMPVDQLNDLYSPTIDSTETMAEHDPNSEN